MKLFDVRSIFIIAAMALVSACGGSASTGQADGHTAAAAVLVHGNAPVADCEAEGCNQPRIVDGLAEQYRFSAVQQQQQQEQPAGLTVIDEPLAQPLPGGDATEAAPAAVAQAE